MPKLIKSGRQISLNAPENGLVSWKSPSNIAIVKYWGKRHEQIPSNPSVSFTLSEAHTITRLSYIKKDDTQSIDFRFLFEGKENPGFSKRVDNYLNRLSEDLPFLKHYHLEIVSENSFPHSSGIASSASAMSALALCLCSMEEEVFGDNSSDEDFDLKASYLSRLGSGSASRSIYPTAAIWGEMGEVKGSSNEYALGINDLVNDVFKSYQNKICIISTSEKKVSSTAGHEIMNQHAYSEARILQAKQHTQRCLDYLRTGDEWRLGQLMEQEALGLHGLMMSSNTPYLLLEPGTIEAIQELWAFRNESKIPVFFSLDAGPNLHVMYHQRHEAEISSWMDQKIRPYCEGGKIIEDHIGRGAEQIS